MAVAYEPNLEGALQVLVDLMSGHGFTMTRQPYAPNYRGRSSADILMLVTTIFFLPQAQVQSRPRHRPELVIMS